MRTYRIQMAARLSGLNDAVIRAWERRYGVPKPRRTAAGYRVYTEQDIALLRRLKQLTEEGMAIGDAVALAPALTAADAAARGDGTPRAEWTAEILAAAERLDQAAVESVLDAALATLAPLRAYDELLVPVLQEVGERWHAGRLGVAEEHLVSHAIRTRLGALLRAAPGGGGGHVLCACFPEEEHDVGILGAALHFRHAGFRTTVLGMRTPVEQVVRAARRLEPDVVALSCVQDPGAREVGRVLRAVRAALPAKARLVVGGGGAAAHADTCVRAGAEPFAGDGSWSHAVQSSRR